MYKHLSRPYLGVEFLVVLGGLVALGRTSEELGARGADVFTAQRVCAYGRVCRGARWRLDFSVKHTPSATLRFARPPTYGDSAISICM